MLNVEIRMNVALDQSMVVALYEANEWSSAAKPDLLMKGLAGSHAVVSAWDGEQLIGLGNALSDGHLVVYYPHLLVHPDWQSRGVGQAIVSCLQKRYKDFHQHSLISDPKAVSFYEKCGFRKAGHCQAMWIYNGNDH